MQKVLNCFDSHVIQVFFKQVTLSIVTIVFHVQFDFAPVYSASEGHEGHKQTEKAYLSSWMNIGQSQHWYAVQCAGLGRLSWRWRQKLWAGGLLLLLSQAGQLPNCTLHCTVSHCMVSHCIVSQCDSHCTISHCRAADYYCSAIGSPRPQPNSLTGRRQH